MLFFLTNQVIVGCLFRLVLEDLCLPVILIKYPRSGYYGEGEGCVAGQDVYKAYLLSAFFTKRTLKFTFPLQFALNAILY